jgi:hypothetical protein
MSYEHHQQTGTIVDAEDDQVVATMSDSATPDQANLLAAALDLLEALEDAVSTQPADSPIKWVLRARTAIAKAKGAA